jgi:hypothetical protein
MHVAKSTGNPWKDFVPVSYNLLARGNVHTSLSCREAIYYAITTAGNGIIKIKHSHIPFAGKLLTLAARINFPPSKKVSYLYSSS